MDFTSLIEKTLRSLSKTRGEQFARLYMRYSTMANFAVVCLLGMAVYFVLSSLLGGFLGMLLGALATFVWLYLNIMGTLAYSWGFKPKPEPKMLKKKKTTVKKKVAQKQ